MIAATLLMAIAAIAAEALHRRIRRGHAVHRLAGVTVLRLALVAGGVAMPTLLLTALKGIGL